MSRNRFLRQASSTIRRFPWLLTLGHALWHLFQAKYTIGAVGVVFDDHDRVLLVEHAFHARFPWGLPGGWVNRQEQPAIAVRREIMEELALSVDVGPLLLAEIPYKNHLDLAYLCQYRGLIGNLSHELLDYDWFSLDEMPAIMDVHRRAIECAVTARKLRSINDEPGV